VNIGYVTSNDFWGPRLIEALNARGHDTFVGQPTADINAVWFQLGQVARQCDMVIADWAQPPTDLVLSSLKLPTVVIAHRIEMYNADRVNWEWGNCDALITVGEFIGERFLKGMEKQRPRRTCVVSHAGIDLEKFTPGAEGVRKWEPPWEIVVAGNVVPKKRQYTLIQMLADLPEEFHLHIIGRGGHLPGYGNAEYLQNCSDLVASLGDRIKGRMVHTNHLPQTPADMTEQHRADGVTESLLDVYRRSHIIAAATNEESSACVLAEGMACGMFPAGNNWRGYDAFYPEWSAWDTPADFVRLLKRWARLSPERKQKRADEARAWAEAKFDSKRVDAERIAIIEAPTHPAATSEYYDRHPMDAMRNEEAAVGGDRLALVEEFAQGDFLDLGCGTGWALEAAGQAGCGRRDGQDVWEQGCILADKRDSGDTYQMDATCSSRNIMHGLVEGPWDTVAALDFFEQVNPKHHADILALIGSQARPGARIIVTVPTGAQPGGKFREQVFPKVLRNQIVAAGFGDVLEFREVDDGQRFAIVAQKEGA